VGEAAGDLVAWTCGDGRQELTITSGGIPGINAAAHAAVL
jgi:predicted Rossmann fold nucleotide-binding protein DprA/Smf involved in DNA uptake